jgi:Acyl-protein synthetase, LuxE
MFSLKDFKQAIFIQSAGQFGELAIELFRYQYQQNIIYHNYVDAINIDPKKVKILTDIPFLPIQFFKTHRVTDGRWEAEKIFESSGTTQTINSRHYVKDLYLYNRSCLHCFNNLYGNIDEYVVLGLLPSYLERNNSSLVYMVEQWTRRTNWPENGFYLDDHKKLAAQLTELEKKKQKTILIGVTFALLDFAETFPMKLKYTMVMETGGMKGRKKEMTREAVHNILKKNLGLENIHSEYGMTELLSQAYAPQSGIFNCPSTMKVLVRDEFDPLRTKISGAGVLNIIDLVNIHSCSFIATEDIGKVYEDGTFEVMGRLDGSALRGCSLMVS